MADKQLEGKELAFTCIKSLADKKAKNIILLDLKGKSDVTDYFLICSGTSDRHVKALYENLYLYLKKDRQILPNHVEGQKMGHWVLMDYSELVIHIFYDYIRDYYDLEGLWKSAEKMAVPGLENDPNVITPCPNPKPI